jgi:hypothetical protein
LNARNVVNNNVSAESTFFDVEKKLKDETLYTGGQIKPTNSEFKRVLVRRKSRQSVNAPTVIDIDYKGNSSGFAHLIGNKASCASINFGMNLRNYKNDTDFQGKEPFLFPAKREFKPEE